MLIAAAFYILIPLSFFCDILNVFFHIQTHSTLELSMVLKALSALHSTGMFHKGLVFEHYWCQQLILYHPVPLVIHTSRCSRAEAVDHD